MLTTQCAEFSCEKNALDTKVEIVSSTVPYLCICEGYHHITIACILYVAMCR